MIVVTFLEDALRIVTQWGDQKYYLQKHRGFPWGISHIFLLVNVLVSGCEEEGGRAHARMLRRLPGGLGEACALGGDQSRRALQRWRAA